MDNNVVYDASLDAQMEERNEIEQIRDDSQSIKVGNSLVGKIKEYKFRILVRDKEDLVGSLSREDMEKIHRLYTTQGSGLTQRSVSREFSQFTFEEFKKILRAFNITKASSPLAPHIIEERSLEDQVKLTFQHRENDYLKKLEQERASFNENRVRELYKENINLKNQILNFKEFVKELEFKVKPLKFNPVPYKGEDTIIVYISDMHIGAEVSEYSIYSNTFNFDVASERLTDLTRRILETCLRFKISNIVVCNIGDSLDGYNGETTRGGHKLPQNMNNKDQFKNYVQMMLNFFADLSVSEMFSTIKYYCVDGGNHDGDFGYIANKSLEACLAILNPDIQVKIFDRFIDYFRVGKHAFVLCHGKDSKDMFKNLPLVLNDKTENQINEYLDYVDIDSESIHFVKGDLHQSATTYGKRFRYKSVSSLFGSSEWIHKNFGNTPAAVDFDIILSNNILETRIVF